MSPNKIVITGTIASGKSTLSNLIKDLGFDVISADEINYELLEKGKANYIAIKSSGEFDDAFDKDILNKKKLAKIIFSDKSKLKRINNLTHKNILDEIEKRVKEINSKAVFIEIPLYFQMDIKYDVDEVWLVTADIDTQISRLMNRDFIDYDYAKEKIETQKDLIKMKAKSDVIFNNSTSLDSLKDELKKVLDKKGLL